MTKKGSPIVPRDGGLRFADGGKLICQQPPSHHTNAKKKSQRIGGSLHSTLFIRFLLTNIASKKRINLKEKKKFFFARHHRQSRKKKSLKILKPSITTLKIGTPEPNITQLQIFKVCRMNHIAGPLFKCCCERVT